MLADGVTKAKYGQAIFQWSDGDRYYSTSVLYADAMRLQATQREDASQQTQSVQQSIIQEARKQCIAAGEFKVGINNRPALPNGGWEVWVKCKSMQVWSIGSSNAHPVADTLEGTVVYANRVAKSRHDNELKAVTVETAEITAVAGKKIKKASKG